MIKIQTVRLADLNVNKDNDRHGETESEDAAVAELLARYPDKMRALARDIVRQKRVYERPLVAKIDGAWIVFDGNRRVTCLKLLTDPSSSPSAEWAQYFLTLKKDWKPPSRIEVETSDDLEEVNEIVFRRHTGGQSGIGRLAWDNPAKSNFQHRIGKATRLELGRLVEELLKTEGLIPGHERTPRTNIERLLSSNSIRQRVGFVVERRQIVFTRDRAASLAALARIVSDLKGRTINISGLIRNSDKNAYLDTLEIEGVLPQLRVGERDTPAIREEAPKSEEQDGGTKDGSSGTPEMRPRRERTRLIPPALQPTWSTSHDVRRLQAIWGETQARLDFQNHANSIAMLFRAILELSVDRYIADHDLLKRPTDSLHMLVDRCAADLKNKGLIDGAYEKILKKMSNSDGLISCHTLNQFVHSKDYFPSPHHMRSMWDTLEPFIVALIEK